MPFRSQAEITPSLPEVAATNRRPAATSGSGHMLRASANCSALSRSQSTVVAASYVSSFEINRTERRFRRHLATLKERRRRGRSLILTTAIAPGAGECHRHRDL